MLPFNCDIVQKISKMDFFGLFSWPSLVHHKITRPIYIAFQLYINDDI